MLLRYPCVLRLQRTVSKCGLDSFVGHTSEALLMCSSILKGGTYTSTATVTSGTTTTVKTTVIVTLYPPSSSSQTPGRVSYLPLIMNTARLKYQANNDHERTDVHSCTYNVFDTIHIHIRTAADYRPIPNRVTFSVRKLSRKTRWYILLMIPEPRAAV